MCLGSEKYRVKKVWVMIIKEQPLLCKEQNLVLLYQSQPTLYTLSEVVLLLDTTKSVFKV